jgi:hypothetical protein
VGVKCSITLAFRSRISSTWLVLCADRLSKQAIENDVDLPARLAGRDDLFEETDDLRAGVPLGRFALHLAGLDLQRRVQRQRAIAPILEAVPFQPSGQ